MQRGQASVGPINREIHRWNVPHKPLGFEISHRYEDLIFVNLNITRLFTYEIIANEENGTLDNHCSAEL